MDGAQVAGAMAGVLCAAGGILIVGTLIGAVILRAACSLFNKMAGQDRAVPEPSFGKALGITVVSMIANMAVGFMVGIVIGGGGAAAGANPQHVQIISTLVSLPVGFLVMSGMLTLMLPTSFGRGMLVALLQYAISFAIAIAIGLIVFLVVLLLGVGFAGR
jgi:hypothetical protein